MYHGSVCVALCVEPVLKVEGEREEKRKIVGKHRKKKFRLEKKLIKKD